MVIYQLHMFYLSFETVVNNDGNSNNDKPRRLDKPGSCENRLASSYSGFTTSSDFIFDAWTFTTNPDSNEVGNDNFMEYPNPNIWQLTFDSQSDSSQCGDVIWSTVLSLAHILNIDGNGCVNSDGNTSFTFVYDENNDEYRLEGAIYLYLVSNYQSLSYDQVQENYLFHGIENHPISIVFNSMHTFSDVSHNAIDELSFRLSLFGNTLTGTSYDEDTKVLSMHIRTYCPDYMVFNTDTIGFTWIFSMDANVTLLSIVPTLSNDGECFTSSLGRCWQQYIAEIRINDCNEDTGVSLDNSYMLWLDSAPANDSNADDISRWMTLTGANGLNDSAVIFFDLLEFNYFESCEEFVYTVDIDSSITSYEDDSYNDSSSSSLISMNNPLFVTNSGDQRLYVQIELADIDELVELLDMEILDIWFCVFKYPNTTTSMNDEVCFDVALSSLETWFLYSQTSSSTDDGYMTQDDIVTDDTNFIEQFSFIIPIVTNTDADTIAIQINTELTLNDNITFIDSSTRRRSRTRRVLMSVNNGAVNILQQSSGVISFKIVEEADSEGSDPKNEGLFGEGSRR